MSNIKKKHHYIWRYYLKAWSSNESLINCYFINDNHFAIPNLMGIGARNHFYKSYELTPDDIYYLQDIIDKNDSPIIRQVNQRWLDSHILFYEMHKQLKSINSEKKKINLEEINNIKKIYEANNIENTHYEIEKSAIDILDELRVGKTNELFSEEGKIADFLLFLSMQFVRTNNIRNRTKSIYLESENQTKLFLPNWSYERTCNLETLIFGTNIASSIHRDIKNYSFDLIQNKTEYPYLTADQPVINLGDPAIEEDIFFYYPLSPDYCLIVQPKRKKKYIEHTIDDVHYLNNIICEFALEQIYTNDLEYLKYLLKNNKSIQNKQ